MIKRNLSAIIIISLMIYSLGYSVSAEISSNQISPDATIKLVIATRHDSTIYNKFAEAFAATQLAHDVGITSKDEIKFYAPTTYDGFYKTMTNEFFEADLGWGGGPTLFNNLVEDGAISPINDTVLSYIDNAVPDEIAGAKMKSYNDAGEMMWVANAISSFGFTVNHKELEKRGLPVPHTWEDLASPTFFTSISEPNIAMGNAPDTTSNTRIYQIILQKYGWEKGWEILYDMAGNGNIYGGSVETRQAVISGETAVSMTIDFYGLIAMQENPDTEYIVPTNGSIVNGDPIAYAKAPHHLEAANAFMKFVFSQEGQALWTDSEINRLPVREDAFDTDFAKSQPSYERIKELYNQTLENQGITFNETLALSLEETMRYHFEATITNIHPKLQSTWADIVSAYKGGAFSDNRFDQINEVFGRPAITMKEAQEYESQISVDPAFRVSKQTEWEENMTAKFSRAEEMITEPETILTTGSNGTVITSISEAVSVSSTYTDVPISVLSAFVAVFFSFVMVYTKKRKI